MSEKKISAEKMQEEIMRFKEEYAWISSKNNRYADLVVSIMDSLGMTIEELSQAANISTKTVCRIRSGTIKYNGKLREYNPHMKTITAFCIACELNGLKSMTLFESLGTGFKKSSKTESAYHYIITNFRGKSVHECNDFLRVIGLPECDLLGG